MSRVELKKGLGPCRMPSDMQMRGVYTKLAKTALEKQTAKAMGRAPVETYKSYPHYEMKSKEPNAPERTVYVVNGELYVHEASRRFSVEDRSMQIHHAWFDCGPAPLF
jgi:hypothetical protein